MTALLVRRAASLIPLLVCVSLIVHGMGLLIPGDPAVSLAGEGASQAEIDAVRERLGLEGTYVERYLQWVRGAVSGDLGTSLLSDRSVVEAVSSRLGVTLSLTLATLVITLVAATIFGVLAATNPGGWVDRAATALASAGIAVPNFWVGMLLVLLFAVHVGWLPATGYVHFQEDPIRWLRHISLPALALAPAAVAEGTRQLRASMLEVLQRDYIRAAEARGLRRREVLFKHALRNAAPPFVTVVGLQGALLLGNALIVEQVFAIPGIGQLAVRAVLDGDLPMLQGVVLALSVVVLLANLLVDVVCAALNPKVRTS